MTAWPGIDPDSRLARALASGRVTVVNGNLRLNATWDDVYVGMPVEITWGRWPMPEGVVVTKDDASATVEWVESDGPHRWSCDREAQGWRLLRSLEHCVGAGIDGRAPHVRPRPDVERRLAAARERGRPFIVHPHPEPWRRL